MRDILNVLTRPRLDDGKRGVVARAMSLVLSRPDVILLLIISLLATAALVATHREPGHGDSAASSHAIDCHQTKIRSLALSRDGRLVASLGTDCQVWVWQIDGEHHHGTRMEHDDSFGFYEVALSPDHQVLAAAGISGRVHLWDTMTGAGLAVLSGHAGEIKTLIISPDGKTLATAGLDRTIRLWDVGTRRERLVWRTPARGTSLSFSPDGRVLASAYRDGRVVLWDVETGREGLSFQTGPGGISALVFMQGGATLATSDIFSNVVSLWDSSDGRERGRVVGSAGSVYALLALPDGRTLAYAGPDSKIRLWDVVEGRETLALGGQPAWITAMAVSRDGSTLTSGDVEGSIRLWNLRGSLAH
jgi:WD40 repeat protein